MCQALLYILKIFEKLIFHEFMRVLRLDQWFVAGVWSKECTRKYANLHNFLCRLMIRALAGRRIWHRRAKHTLRQFQNEASHEV